MGSRTRFHLAASRVHKWLALIIGAQLLIWFTSGVIMSFLPIEKVHLGRGVEVAEGTGGFAGA